MQSCQLSKSVSEKGQPSLPIPFPDLIRNRIPLSCSSAGISSHTLLRNIKLEKEIMNYWPTTHRAGAALVSTVIMKYNSYTHWRCKKQIASLRLGEESMTS